MESSSKKEAWLNQTIPAEYLLAALDTVLHWQTQPASTLKKLIRHFTQTRQATLKDFYRVFDAFYGFTVVRSGKPLGLALGWHLPPTAYGNIGFALLCAQNFRQVMALFEEYWPLMGRDITAYKTHTEGDTFVITLSTNPLMTGPIRYLWIEGALMSWKRCLHVALGDFLIPTEIWFSHQNRYDAKYPLDQYGTLFFEKPSNQLRFPLRYLDAPLPMRNQLAYESAVELCAKELAQFKQHNSPVLMRVQEKLALRDQGYPTMTQLADGLSMSTRTLRRKLSSEGCSYQELLEQARHRDALVLLKNPTFTIQEISQKLGYSDPANFARRFRQWTGLTPSAFRKNSGNPLHVE
ncbi:MAG: AraC family transcriptional regulator [Pseudomonadales bacterium]|nr:AraC family transcriptional regulator [Pseudomonadales bacterium]